MTTISPIAKPSLGQTFDADLAALHTRVSVLEAKAEADAKSAWAWLKAQWPHFVTWLGVGYAVLKHL